MLKTFGIDTIKLFAGYRDVAWDIILQYEEFGVDLRRLASREREFAVKIEEKIYKKYEIKKLPLSADLELTPRETEYFLKSTWYEHRPSIVKIKYEGTDYDDYLEAMKISDEEHMARIVWRRAGGKTKAAR